jgi:hypothetical protein
MPETGSSGGRRALQITLAVLAGLPFASGLAATLAGPASLPGEQGDIQATLDSEFRFTAAFWFAVAPLIWSCVPRVEHKTVTIRLVLSTVFVGGLARLLSWRDKGRPHPLFQAAIGLELVGMPVIAIWQARVAALAQRAAAPS